MSGYYYEDRDMVTGGDLYEFLVIGGTLVVALVCLCIAGFLIYHFFVRQYVQRYGRNSRAGSRAGSRMGTMQRFPPPPNQQQYQMQPIQSVMQPGEIYKPPIVQETQYSSGFNSMSQPPQNITPTGLNPQTPMDNRMTPQPLDYTDQRSSWPVYSSQPTGGNLSTSSINQYQTGQTPQQQQQPISLPPPPLSGAPPTYTMQSYQAPAASSALATSSYSYQSPYTSNYQSPGVMHTTYRTTTTTTQKALVGSYSAV